MSDPTDGERSDTETHDGDDRAPPRKRQRVRLSCLECRRRKLSCDREFPCSRCVQSGTAERCEYETRPGLAPPNKLGLSQTALSNIDVRLSLPSTGGESPYFRKDARDTDRIRRLELEVAQLKNQLAKGSGDGSNAQEQYPPEPKPEEEPEYPVLELPSYLRAQTTTADKEELRFFRGKEFKTRYFGPHSAFLAFHELTGLCPFMKETSEEWLMPLNPNRNKDRRKGAQERELRFREPDLTLEALLPSKQQTDHFVNVYLDQFEQVHRIVHIPTFKRDYAKFWDPSETRNAAFTALVLSILGVSSCLAAQLPHKFEKMISISYANAIKWTKAADEWQERQSQKHRRMIHYQIACLVYLGKRVNTIKKKRFWKNAGTLTQDAISVGLHREPSHMKSDNITPFNQEMRRRIWATLQSFDLQASFDHGLPSILSSLHYDVNPPSNIDDDEFNEETKELPPSKPSSEYTYSSYQHLSRRSLALRLELSRVLTGPPEDLNYERVIHYTDEISREIDSLPSWNVSESSENDGDKSVFKKPLLAYTLLHIQLRQYIIPLHQPFLRLRKSNSKYQYSEVLYYNAARDMVILIDKLAQHGIRTLNFLREDSLTLAINLCSVTMLQPRNSTNMIMVNSQHTLQLLEKCLAMKEDRILRCGNNEPWGYSIMCAAFGLLEAHLGVKTPQEAKQASADKFVRLHLKLASGQKAPPSSSQQSAVANAVQQQHHNSTGAGPILTMGGIEHNQAHHRPQTRTPVTSFTGIPGGPTAVGQMTPSSSMEHFFRSKVGGFLPPFGYAQNEGLTRGMLQSGTPFPPPSSDLSGAGNNQAELPGTPWWTTNAADPSTIPLNPDVAFEVNDLWGGGTGFWDWDAMMGMH
ncbi:fungal-specific transcription factor domain-containing protein [Podospora fimiseda]|uniref:Fungal-specific transcription factor domain-containing protein n=1 Tax=Podospora fimiseda TaxID=252190 RepID=A0AAN7H5Y5_9PEZI|nr:fungal-specific transcription factor domain-containing protein [Podospora fimiseda]